MKILFRLHLILFVVATSIGVPSLGLAQTSNYDARQSTLTFGLENARDLLADRGLITTSAWFENPESYPIGLGHNYAGVVWGDYAVSFSLLNAITLTNIKDERTRKKGDNLISVFNLRWDDQKQKYVGKGTYYGRGNPDCPLNSMAADIEIGIWHSHPFQGAWQNLTISYNSPQINPVNCQINRYLPITKTAARTFTTVEVIRAIEQAQAIWSSNFPEIRQHNFDFRTKLSGELSEASVEKNKEIQGTIKALESVLAKLEKFDLLMIEIQSALKFGGRVRDINTDEWVSFEKTKALDPVNSKLMAYAEIAFNSAMSVKRAADDIRKKRKEANK